MQYSWEQIEAALPTLEPVAGGFSQAQRGLVKLEDGTQVFVKIGLHDNTRAWARKEIAVYRFLQQHNYTAMPEVLATNADHSSFALTALTAQAGWDWDNSWTDERLTATLAAMDSLAAIHPPAAEQDIFSGDTTTELDDGWQELAGSKGLQTKLADKLRAAGRAGLAGHLRAADEARRSRGFVFRHDSLMHADVRADNCAWNPVTKQVRLVDWNWAQMGDRRVDLAATLTHVQRSGFDLIPNYSDRLDADALHWMAGFWFRVAAKPIWDGGPADLRDFQLSAGITAYELATKVQDRLL